MTDIAKIGENRLSEITAEKLNLPVKVVDSIRAGLQSQFRSMDQAAAKKSIVLEMEKVCQVFEITPPTKEQMMVFVDGFIKKFASLGSGEIIMAFQLAALGKPAQVLNFTISLAWIKRSLYLTPMLSTAGLFTQGCTAMRKK